MSRELFKGMFYKDNKVYTRQCSNNVYPKYFFCEENKVLTKKYNELGQVGFEKWIITYGIIPGNIEVLSGSNKILRKLNYLSNLLWNDKSFRKLKDKENKVFSELLSAKTEKEKEQFNIDIISVKDDIEKYISSFYETHIRKQEIKRDR